MVDAPVAPTAAVVVRQLERPFHKSCRPKLAVVVVAVVSAVATVVVVTGVV